MELYLHSRMPFMAKYLVKHRNNFTFFVFHIIFRVLDDKLQDVREFLLGQAVADGLDK
jgi:hypothetical protein